uniref:Uncharacterized protein n=1 Tax=Salix viminalis TaxID=40686 RepID=A0A6N2LYA6_SALVM
MKNTLRKQQQKIDLARLITFRQPLPPPRPRSQVLRQQLHPGIADIQTRDHSCCFQASVNSISSMPSPVYQCKKAFLLNIAVNCSLTRLNISWMEVEFPMKVRGSGVFSSRIDSMLSANNLPELGTDLVTALSSLNIKKKRQAG